MRCLIKSGYSRATARLQKQAGLTAESCIAEAAKLDGMAHPAKMLEAGRARAMLAIQSCDPVKVPLKDTMKMLDTVEKYYGGHEIPVGSALTTVADRLSQIAALMALAQRRGLPVPSFIDAEVVATASANVPTDNVRRDATPDGTTR